MTHQLAIDTVSPPPPGRQLLLEPTAQDLALAKREHPGLSGKALRLQAQGIPLREQCQGGSEADWQPGDRVYTYVWTGGEEADPLPATVIKANRVTLRVRLDSGEERLMRRADVVGRWPEEADR